MRRYFSVKGLIRLRSARLLTGLAVSVAALAAFAASIDGTTASVAATRTTRVDAYITYYGWYDNTPPGCATAFSHGCAHGTGTYSNPITFASDRREFPVGTIVYYPTVEKYFRMSDDCSECDADWQGKGPDGGPRLHHLDLWIGGKGGNERDVIRCEDALTQALPNGTPLQTPVLLNPPAGLPTSTEPLFNTRTNGCFGGARNETYYGRYENRETHQCLKEVGGTVGAPVVAASCSTAANEDLAFDGAFFTVGKLCLASKAQSTGSALVFVTCSGGRRQLWETGTGGTISAVQKLSCISEVNGAIRLGGCKTSGAHGRNQWTYVAEGQPV
jgi:ricin-type beta-trefoil lectin protein